MCVIALIIVLVVFGYFGNLFRVMMRYLLCLT